MSSNPQNETSSVTEVPVPGWYPDPENPNVRRWWNGQAWGPLEPEPRAVQQHAGSWPIERNGFATSALVLGIVALALFWFPYLAAVLGGVAVVLGILAIKRVNLVQVGRTKAVWGLTLGAVALSINLLIAFAVSNSSNDRVSLPQGPVQESQVTPEQGSTAEPEPTEEPVSEIVAIGTPIVTPNFTIVIDSVEVLDQIDTVHGEPIVAPEGTKLVMVYTTTTVTGNAQDLTCGSDVFSQAKDSEGAEMAHIFEGPRIPGNPQCNHKTSAGETVAWNFGFKMAADRQPGTLSVIDTNADGQRGWSEPIIASLQ